MYIDVDFQELVNITAFSKARDSNSDILNDELREVTFLSSGKEEGKSVLQGIPGLVMYLSQRRIGAVRHGPSVGIRHVKKALSALCGIVLNMWVWVSQQPQERTPVPQPTPEVNC